MSVSTPGDMSMPTTHDTDVRPFRLHVTDTELADLQDRLFQLRCAAEDVVTAADDGAGPGELKNLAAAVVKNAHGLERLR